MSIKPHYETYRYTTKLTQVKGQSVVECRLPGEEITSILAVYAKAVPTDCVPTDGEARYNGKLFLTVVYEDADKKICRTERGAEFSHRVTDGLLTPACFTRAAFSVESVKHRKEGASFYISVVVSAEVGVYGIAQTDYLLDGENLVCKSAPQVVVKTLPITGETELEDDFETDYVGDILLCSESVNVARIEAEAGQLVVQGEVALNVCALKADDSLCSYERLVPFRVELPADELLPEHKANAVVCVKSVALTAGTDEDKGKSRISANFVLSVSAEAYLPEELPVVEDAFALNCDLKTVKKRVESKVLDGVLCLTERISGTASLSADINYSSILAAAVTPRAEMTCRQGEAEGVIYAEVLLRDADGTNRSATLSLPFAFPISYGEGLEAEACGTVCGLSVRQRREGEVEAEATLKVTVRVYRTLGAEYITEATAGAPIEENDSAISVYLPSAGESLWEVAKRLHREPSELEKSNPELEFPIQKGKRIFVYRRKY